MEGSASSTPFVFRTFVWKYLINEHLNLLLDLFKQPHQDLGGYSNILSAKLSFFASFNTCKY